MFTLELPPLLRPPVVEAPPLLLPPAVLELLAPPEAPAESPPTFEVEFLVPELEQADKAIASKELQKKLR